MNDFIEITGLRVFSYHGVYAEERSLGQEFILSFKIEIDLYNIGKEDSLKNGICYKELIEKVTIFTKENIYNTLEGLSHNLAQYLLISYRSIISLEVEVKKPHAAIDASFDNIAVRIKRDRKFDTISTG